MAFDQIAYKNDFNRGAYDNVMLRVPKGNREKLKDLAKALNKRNEKGLISVNALIIEAIEQYYHIDISTKP